MSIALIILAAGQGTRMNSDKPKVLHKLAGAPLLWHAMKTGAQIGADKTVVVVGHGGEAVEKSVKTFDPQAEIVWQKEQNGTGHAVQQAQSALAGFDGNALILYGDTPFIRPETLAAHQPGHFLEDLTNPATLRADRLVRLHGKGPRTIGWIKLASCLPIRTFGPVASIAPYAIAPRWQIATQPKPLA